jgi:hypothetical protein
MTAPSQPGQFCPTTAPGQVGQVGQELFVPPSSSDSPLQVGQGVGQVGQNGPPLRRGRVLVCPTCPTTPRLTDFAFVEPPAAGVEVFHRGQRYVAVGSRTHTCRDGRETILVTWSSNCAECAAAFEFDAPLANKGPSRRCSACAAPGRSVGGRRRRKRGEGVAMLRAIGQLVGERGQSPRAAK